MSERAEYIKLPKECAICLEPIKSHSEMGVISCVHSFHRQCLHEWINSESNKIGNICPICMTGIIKDCSKKKRKCVIL